MKKKETVVTHDDSAIIEREEVDKKINKVNGYLMKTQARIDRLNDMMAVMKKESEEAEMAKGGFDSLSGPEVSSEI